MRHSTWQACTLFQQLSNCFYRRHISHKYPSSTRFSIPRRPLYHTDLPEIRKTAPEEMCLSRYILDLTIFSDSLISPLNRQSVSVNGKPYKSNCYLDWDVFVSGSLVELTLSDDITLGCGSGKDALPPSISTGGYN